ncbi:RNA-directed DNA polymerase, eukaryota, reverse transcriptase zinc-binding domain protein [Tanacetum coccineum]
MASSSSCETNYYHCDKCAMVFKKYDQYLKHVNDVHNVHLDQYLKHVNDVHNVHQRDVESLQQHESYHDFLLAIGHEKDPYLLKSESTTTSPIMSKPLESESTPSKPKEEDLFKLEKTEEMIEVDQAIRSLKSPDWSPHVSLDYSTDVFLDLEFLNEVLGTYWNVICTLDRGAEMVCLEG